MHETAKVMKKIQLRSLLVALAATVASWVLVAPSAVADLGIVKWDGEGPVSQGGGAFSQAGGHPYEIATTVEWESHLVPSELFGTEAPYPDEPIRDVLGDLPPGLVGNPSALPRCNQQQLAGRQCPQSSQLGYIQPKDSGMTLAAGLYNMVPAHGQAALFGFNILGTTFSLEGALRQGPPLHSAIDMKYVSQALPLVGARIVFWGTPADSSHDVNRCTQPLFGFSFSLEEEGGQTPFCEGEPGTADAPTPANVPETPFITLPTSCTGEGIGLKYDVAIDSWDEPGVFDTASFKSHEAAPYENVERGTENCDEVPSEPDLKLQPTGRSASSPTGLDVVIDVPTEGLNNKEGVAQAHIKKTVVTLPDGITINPSQGEGLGVCTTVDYAAESADVNAPGGCPATSKLGTVQVETPLLEERLTGAIYLAQPDNVRTSAAGAENPFDSLLALYVVLRNAERGILIKLPGKVDTDEQTGQVTTTFDDLPQVPFSSFALHFREGARSPLVTPAACGTYTAQARFTPWSDPSIAVQDTASFEVIKGVDEGPCPSGGLPPFKPGLIAGSINNAAGAFSPFNVRLFRSDEEQEITHFSIKLPPGISGKLAGVPFCPDSSIEAAKLRTGTEELASPSCPLASEVGRTLVGAGVGSVQTYAPGKVYLAGPYNGNPLSIAAITAAKVGPFDLGTVVVREALDVNPETAEVFIDSAGSDPIPHIIDGITTHIRDIRVYVDKPEFTLNPTSCDPTSTASTVLGSGLDFASGADDQPITVSTRYQAADCAALGFKPRLSLKLKGGTKRGGHPALKATLRMRGTGESNIARAQVTLPPSEFLDQAHLNNVCTRVQFNQGAGGGANCPPASIYGKARATTPILDEALEGNVFLRSSEHKLPDLVAALHSGKIEIHVVGRIDSVKGGQIRTTFEGVPDAPVSKFSLEMGGGKKGLLENSTNLCKGKHRAIVAFDAHNGKVKDFNPALQADCSKARHKHKR